MRMNEFILRFGALLLACLAATGLAIFLAYFIQGFSKGEGKGYEYSCPLTGLWAGLGTLCYCFIFLVWWSSSKNRMINAPRKSGLAALRVWTVIGIIFALEGAMAVVGWAIAANEIAASGLSSFWIVSGVVSAWMCLIQVNRKEKQSLEEESNAAWNETGCCSKRCKCCRCCCTCGFWVDFFLLFLVAFLMVFCTGLAIQASMSAADTNKLSSPGEIYSISVDGRRKLRMHLNCFGGNHTTSNDKNNATTVIFEHGGGANSLTMMALAEEIVLQYNTRACVYDRLGYGFTPSFYTASDDDNARLPNTGIILSLLLTEAGESGPFVCVGHSAGSEACLWFASEQQHKLTGVAMLDGYPDLIRAGSLRPGQAGSDSILGLIQTFAVMFGATGLTRGIVGNPGSTFVPARLKKTTTSLYAQVRFWFAQYWDVRGDLGISESNRLYQRLGGIQNDQGLYSYGGTLLGTKVLVIPASTTVDELDCESTPNEWCCDNGKNSSICENQSIDRSLYRNQTFLYASTLSSDVSGLVVDAPTGSKHDFVYHRDYYEWIATQIAEQLLQ